MNDRTLAVGDDGTVKHASPSNDILDFLAVLESVNRKGLWEIAVLYWHERRGWRARALAAEKRIDDFLAHAE